MELWQYFKGLPFEYTVEGFWKRHQNEITRREEQWRNDTKSTLSGSAHTEWSINKHLSAFPDYYHNAIRWRMYACAELFLIKKGQNLVDNGGHINQYFRDNKEELNRLYKEFCQVNWLAHTTILSNLFKDGAHNFRGR